MHPAHNDGLSAEVQRRMRDDFAAGKPEPLPVYLALEGGRDKQIAREYLALCGDSEQTNAADGSRRIGPYRIVKELSRGGQAIVYLAEDGRLNRKLALKVLSGLAGASPSTIARFRREAEVAARLDHPCICPVLEAGEAGGVHRDLKPGNIMVTPEGEPVVLDFGLAHDAEGQTLTQTETIADFQGHALWVNATAYTPDGKRLLTGSDDNTVRLWDRAPLRLLQIYRCPAQAIDLEVSADGTSFWTNGKLGVVRFSLLAEEAVVRDPLRILEAAEQAAGVRLHELDLVPIR